jgi:hypothetical protein
MIKFITKLEQNKNKCDYFTKNLTENLDEFIEK